MKAILLVVSLALVACAHEPPRLAAPVSAPVDVVAHDAGGCIKACAGAAAVQLADTPEHGELCRCWAPNAFAYTFSFPGSAEQLEYAKARWENGLRTVQACQKEGLAWGPDGTGDNVVCVKPSSARGRNYEAPHVIRSRADTEKSRT